MTSRRLALLVLVLAIAAGAVVLALHGSRKTSVAAVHLDAGLKGPFNFVAYGDARFHDPADTAAANATVRVALVQAIADVNPAFVCFSGDLVFNGFDENDWKIWDSETSPWREKKIPVYPSLGNHEFRGNLRTAMGNYFKRFPDLKGSHYYSVRAANTLLLALDSSQEEVIGPQGEWLIKQLDQVPSDVNFVFLMLHHPLYTSSSESGQFPGGHPARSWEQALAKLLEDRQAHAPYRIAVFSGHVHNYERHEHGGVTYFVSGGGGARPVLIPRAKSDLYQSSEVNFHYLFVQVNGQRSTITMNRVDMSSGKAVWMQPDKVTIAAPGAAAAAGAGGP
jgi:Icc-related predicted phosphoesterase